MPDRSIEQVLITGGCGFIGANLARYYLEKGVRVVVYDSLERKGCISNLEWLRERPNADRLELLVGDVRLPTPALREAVAESDALFHMAGQVAVTTSVDHPVEDFQINADGTLNMLELVRTSNGKQPTFFYASTNKVYGGMEDVRVREGEQRFEYLNRPHGIAEDQHLDFHSPYGCSKGCGDQYVRDYARMYDLDTVVFRQSCVYGYRQFGLEDQGWLAWFVIAAQLGLPIVIYGNGKQVRDVLFIEDLLEAYDQALRQIDRVSGEIFNIGGGMENAISLLDLVELIRSEIDPAFEVSYEDWRPGDQRIYVSDIRKARDVFGWAPQTDWRSGVEKLVAWVDDHRPMLERMFTTESAVTA